MSIYLCGDTHGFGSDFQKIKDWNSENKKELSKDDLLIQLGDAGWIWYPIGTHAEQEYWCNWLGTRNYTILVVLGNHCNYDEIENLPECEMFGGTVQYYESVGRFGTGRIYFAKRGEIYTIEDKTFWAFGGALSLDKDIRTLGIDYWEGELATWYEYEHGMKSLDKVDWKVDYVVTHTCPMNVIGDFISATIWTQGKFKDPTAEYLMEVYKKLSFKEWFSGHLHVDKTIDYGERGKFTVCYNNLPKRIF